MKKWSQSSRKDDRLGRAEASLAKNVCRVRLKKWGRLQPSRSRRRLPSKKSPRNNHASSIERQAFVARYQQCDPLLEPIQGGLFRAGKT